MLATLVEWSQSIAGVGDGHDPCGWPLPLADRVAFTGAMSPSTGVRVFAGTVALVAGLGGLAACGTSAGTKDTRAKADGDTVTVQTSEGTAPGQGLPQGFPEQQIPLLDEKVVNGVTGSADGAIAWSVVMTSDRAVTDLSRELRKQFADAGYTARRPRELADVSIHQFTNDTWNVAVTIARTGDGITITYLVKGD
jgi:hypothetical protein